MNKLNQIRCLLNHNHRAECGCQNCQILNIIDGNNDHCQVTKSISDSSKMEPTDHISQVGKKVDVVANAKAWREQFCPDTKRLTWDLPEAIEHIEALIERVKELEAENKRMNIYQAALNKIIKEEGKVCDNFENCHHESCRSSYTSRVIAKQALEDGK